MAQLDSLIILPLIWGLLITLFLHYKFVIELQIPSFSGVKKFRKKKLNFVMLQSSDSKGTSLAYSLVF